MVSAFVIRAVIFGRAREISPIITKVQMRPEATFETGLKQSGSFPGFFVPIAGTQPAVVLLQVMTVPGTGWGAFKVPERSNRFGTERTG